MPKLNPDKVALELAKWLARRDNAIAKLTKAQENIKRLEKSQRRLASKPPTDNEKFPKGTVWYDKSTPEPEPADEVVEQAVQAFFDLPKDDKSDPGEMPTFLKREQPETSALKPDVYEAAHAVANKHNAPPTPEQEKLVAKERAAVRKEHKQAELTGQRRKMPLTGKAALDAIRRGP